MGAQRVPPHSLEAEQSILGSLMLDGDSWDQVADILEPQDFYRPSHQNLFTAIGELKNKNMEADLITVSNHLQNKGLLDSCGGTDYIVELVNKVVSSVNIVGYAKIVREHSLLRKLIQTSSSLIDRAYGNDFQNIEAFVDEAEGEFYKLGQHKTEGGLTGSMEIVRSSMIRIEELYKRKSDVTGVPTGITALDKMTAGLQGGELIIVAARPSMGKTAFSLNLAQHMAIREKKTVAYFSLEMPKDQVMIRMLASEARVNMKDLRSGRIPDSAWPKLIHSGGQLSEAPLFIDDSSGISPLEVRARARRLKAKHGLDIIMIDYLQLMSMKRPVENRQQEVAEISKTLKALAKELNVPVIALAQLNRGVEGRADRRPMLSDLRESGSIEQDADVIMMLYRDEYYDKDDAEKVGHAEVIIGKQRNGPTGTVKMRFEAEYGTFKNAEYEQHHPLPPPPPQQQSAPQPGGAPRNFAPGANI